jgi:hypothetical protein
MDARKRAISSYFRKVRIRSGATLTVLGINPGTMPSVRCSRIVQISCKRLADYYFRYDITLTCHAGCLPFASQAAPAVSKPLAAKQLDFLPFCRVIPGFALLLFLPCDPAKS